MILFYELFKTSTDTIQTHCSRSSSHSVSGYNKYKKRRRKQVGCSPQLCLRKNKKNLILNVCFKASILTVLTRQFQWCHIMFYLHFFIFFKYMPLKNQRNMSLWQRAWQGAWMREWFKINCQSMVFFPWQTALVNR